jgi:hypothetical protein
MGPYWESRFKRGPTILNGHRPLAVFELPLVGTRASNDIAHLNSSRPRLSHRGSPTVVGSKRARPK